MKKTLKFLGSGLLFSALFLTSCSKETQTVDDVSPIDSQDLTITLKAPPSNPIMIDDLGEDANITARTSPANRNRYNIEFSFLTPPTPRQAEVFESAARRWERIIIRDEQDFIGTIPSAFEGFPALVEDGLIDDIIIEVALAPIDGPGNILGQAGPQFIRTDNFLTLTGVMFFDTADLDFLDELDLFEEVILHEMGHVLGVGTLWNVEPFGFDRTLRVGTDEEPFFSGTRANFSWRAARGRLNLPIEGDFGPGTRFSHWDEETLDNELMTGFLNLGDNPLSRITASSVLDLGYGGVPFGDPYRVPFGTTGVAGKSSSTTKEGIAIAEKETLLRPVGFVNMKDN